jgi:arginine decarboxylase
MDKNITENRPWSIDEASYHYGVGYWGPPYFKIGKNGEVEVKMCCCDSEEEKFVSLYKIANELQQRGIEMPVLLRFPNIIASQVQKLNKTFLNKIEEYGYKGTYRGAFPIKVNQQQQVIEEVVDAGRPFNHGLEAGSKPELIIALAHIDDPETLIVCNGYKDQEFIDLALLGTKMGQKVIMVVERPNELQMIIERSVKLNVRPNLGIRAKLSSVAGGKWSASGGDRSIFGLNAAQIIDAIDYLKETGYLDCMKLLHYHLGSQIPNIRDIQQAAKEALRFYLNLKKEGAAMGYLDIGGGLAVDYDGSKTDFAASRNYSLEEYCADIIDIFQQGCDAEQVEHPTIVSESGRALIAYSSVLLFNILDVNRLDYQEIPETLPEESNQLLKDLLETCRNITVNNMQEMYHDSLYFREEIGNHFMHGTISLREKATADQIFWKVIDKISTLCASARYVPEELQDLEKTLVDVYYGNFSVFQSIPDNWAINQLFPILPIHRLQQEPEEPAIIADITCDSDGKINDFISLYEEKPYINFHNVIPGEDYIIGTFLVGAYQETLGDLHNLFGDTHVTSIVLNEDDRLLINKEVQGDTVADVLSYVEYNPKDLLRQFRDKAEKAVSNGTLALNDRKTLMAAFKNGLEGYTYFEQEEINY